MKFEEWWVGWLKWDKAKRNGGFPADNKFDLARSCWNAASRAGQEGWREKALRYVDDSVKAGKSHRSVLIGLADLPLEGDE